MPLTDPETFKAWAESPLTQEFLGLLGRRQRSLEEAWGRGRSLSAEQQAQAVLLGKLSRLRYDDDPEDDAASIRDLAGLEEIENG